MLLRASGEKEGARYDLDLVSGSGEGDGGVAHGRLLLRFTDAVFRGSRDELELARRELEEKAGQSALVTAAATVAIFSCNVRVADATGIPLDPEGEEGRERIAARVGVERYRDQTTGS